MGKAIGRWSWAVVVGVVVLGGLLWFGVDRSRAGEATDLGPPVVLPSQTASPADSTAPPSPSPDADPEPTIEHSQAAPPKQNPSGSSSGSDSGSNSGSSGASGAERINPAPPPSAGDDDEADDDESEDADESEED